ncbi:MAG: hypothetical protein ACRD1E_03845, partial [Terriglobales bacterium]
MNNELEGVKRPPRGVRATADQHLLGVAQAFRRGDFRVRVAPESGVAPALAEALNQGLDSCQHLAGEVERLCRSVGKQGDASERAQPSVATGAW